MILQIKENIKNKRLTKLQYHFHEEFCGLIENVISNFENKDLEDYILDNYGIAQLSLCSIVVQWIKTKEEVNLSKKEIDKVFGIIYNFIKREYGDEFFELTEIFGLFTRKEIENITSPESAIKNASIIIKNIHPNVLNSKLCSFILEDYKNFTNFHLDSLKIVTSDKETFIKQYKSITKLLKVMARMKKYDEKSRLNFFNEFKGKKEYLSSINYILSGLKQKPLINLDNEFEDIDLLIEVNKDLIKKNEDLSLKNEKVIEDLELKIKEADELKIKISELKAKAKNLHKELSSKSFEVKEWINNNNDLTTRLFNINQALEKAKTKINNYRHIEVCGKIEDYFYNIISPQGREEINKELEDKDKYKVGVYINKINNEYPNYFNKIKNDGIDCYRFLEKINTFRIQNNNECHNKHKVNY